MVDPKHPMLVAVERDRLAPGLQIGAGRMEIGKGRLALDKLQMHQSAGRVVDKHQQSALRPAVLEPPMLAAVDLHQFANALAPRPWLVNPLALLAITPQPGFDHPLAQRFTTNRDAVILAQLLGRQGRAKIPVPLADDRQNRAPQCLGLAPVAAATAPLRDQAARTFDPIGLQQPKHLTPLKPEQLPRRSRSSAAADPNPAAPPAAKAPDRSSVESSPPTPPGNPPGSVICNWQRSDILIGRLHMLYEQYRDDTPVQS